MSTEIRTIYTFSKIWFLVFMLCCSCLSIPDEEKSEPYENPHFKTPPQADLTLEIFGEQFKWTARYPGEDRELGKAGYRLIDTLNPPGIDYTDTLATDDFLETNAIHLPTDCLIRFQFRSRDVIHSAYFPHFKMQSNVVPGQRITMDLETKQTTAEMRKKLDQPDFDFMLFCNRICGAEHYLMHQKIIVDEQVDFLEWYKSKLQD